MISTLILSVQDWIFAAFCGRLLLSDSFPYHRDMSQSNIVPNELFMVASGAAWRPNSMETEAKNGSFAEEGKLKSAWYLILYETSHSVIDAICLAPSKLKRRMKRERRERERDGTEESAREGKREGERKAQDVERERDGARNGEAM